VSAADDLFDRAVALFNARDFHAAHEEWETLWNDAEGPRRDWLQGLIQVAAAFFHVERGYHATGFVKLMRSAQAKLAAYDASGERMRFDLLEKDLLPWRRHADLVEQGRGLREGLPPLPTIRMRAAEGEPA
jgi:predicted metal-dependent hydrolase